VAGKTESLHEAATLAQVTIATGKAEALLEEYTRLSNVEQ